MKKIFLLLTVVSFSATAQKLKKADKAIVANLQTNIGYLADDKLEGRRTGTAGEKLAYEYISKAFANAGLVPKGDNGTYIQNFEVNDGREVSGASFFTINNNKLELNKDYFPFSFSGIRTFQSRDTPGTDNMFDTYILGICCLRSMIIGSRPLFISLGRRPPRNTPSSYTCRILQNISSTLTEHPDQRR